jgi:hypothetical protein
MVTTTVRKQPQRQSLSFVEVARSAMASRFEVELTHGVVVRVPMDFDSEALGRLLAVLEQRP